MTLTLTILIALCAFAAGWQARSRTRKSEGRSEWWLGFDAGRDFALRGERLRHGGGEVESS
jgi:hypothetical protein